MKKGSNPPPNIPNKPTPPPAPPRKMSEKNPKEEFKNELIELILRFEGKTGVEVMEINVLRVRELSGSGIISGLSLKLK